MKTTRKLLSPDYMKQFSCIGNACEDTCCIGWKVTIDQATYKKYKKLRNPVLKNELDKHVKRNRTESSPQNYAHINMDAEGECPLLTEDKLCSIQVQEGESYLSFVCNTYPRLTNKVNNIYEKSGTMSCPEIARLALLRPGGLEFDESEETIDLKYNISGSINTNNSPASSAQKYLWELRIFSIEILQNRNFSLSERLIILGLFLQKVQNHIDSGQLEEQLPSTLNAYMNMIEQNTVGEIINDIPTSSLIQMQLLKKITDMRVGRGVGSKRYLECFSEFLHGVQYSAESSIEEILIKYQDAFEKYYTPFIREHEYILENYLVNYIFKNLFPVRNSNFVFDEYVMLVIHYSMIKLQLIGMAGYHQNSFNTNHVLKLIQSFAKTVEHSSAFLQELKDLLREKGFTSMAYMAILIKNN